MNEVERNNAKQQIVDKIKSSTNILVTVSKDPSVDDLSATIGLTALLNKLGKHTTAIFSGSIPPAITFLDPGKVFENSADSLRDFIIALDKEKADHLRYKVEGDVVKIFITPYRTTITSDDLEFSQGDFNVELVLALGVSNQENLDVAMAAHGGILKDVTIATFSAGQQVSQLGSIDWHDETASSLCEMVTNISEALKADKPLLDKQIATALLTGIVAATDRFSNTLTTSVVMTMAAQLMAAGADQQLIAAKLQESHEIDSLPVSTISENEKSEKPAVTEAPIEAESEQSTLPPDSIAISHGEEKAVETALPKQPKSQPEPTNYPTSTLPPTVVPEKISKPSPPEAIVPEQKPETIAAEAVAPPLLGGILNATTDLAAEDNRRELENQQNKTILSHSYLGGAEPDHNTLINSAIQTNDTQSVDIFSGGPLASLPPTINLPLPPSLPDFSTLPPPPLPDFKAVTPEPISSVSSEPATNDPSQFKIPG